MECPKTVHGMIDLVKKQDTIHRKSGVCDLGDRRSTQYAHQQMESDLDDDNSTESEESVVCLFVCLTASGVRSMEEMG